MKFQASFSNNTVQISDEDGNILRSVSDPIHMNTYKFRYKKDEYWFLYEEIPLRGKVHRSVYLYPINEFKENRINL